MYHYPYKNKGISAGIAAGIFWGTPFLVPVLLKDFSAFEIMFGRYVFFALVSICYLPRILRLLQQLEKREFLKLILLSASGYWLYTFVLFLGIKLTNGVIASLILGSMPLTLTLCSKPYYNLRLICGLLFILIGLGFLLIPPLWDQGLDSSISIWGIILLFAALSLWTWFGINNSHFMHKHPNIKAVDYSSTMGLLSFIIVLPVFLLSQNFTKFLQHPALSIYLFWCFVLGVGASWLANILWTFCSKNCPRSIIGPLLTSETIFALLYSFIYESRLPYFYELIAIFTLIFGVIFVLTAQALR